MGKQGNERGNAGGGGLRNGTDSKGERVTGNTEYMQRGNNLVKSYLHPPQDSLLPCLNLLPLGFSF